MHTFQGVADYGHDGYRVVVVASILIVMQSLMVGGRVLSRYLQKAALAADDYVLFAATTLGFGLCALAIAFPRIAAFASQISMIEQTSASAKKINGQV